MKKIEQVMFGKNMSFFKKGLMDKWKLKEYNDINKPCLFFGTNTILEDIKKHKGFKLIYPVDIGCKRIDTLVGIKNLIVIDRPFIKLSKEIKKVACEFDIKDYSNFKPNFFGDKIYIYLGSKLRAKGFGFDRINEIQKKINFQIIYTIRNNIEDYLSIEKIKSEFYDKCFLNLNFSTYCSGLTTAIELAYMGRKTIMNTNMNYDFLLPYKTDEDIVRIINEESEKIGTIQPEIISSCVEDEWVNVDYWFSKAYLLPMI